MKRGPIQIIELPQSDPKKRGQAYGEAARDKIRRILSIYREIFKTITGESYEKTLDRGKRFLTSAKKYAPDLIEEVLGISEGVGCSFEDIFLLNARSEILFKTTACANECTSIVSLPEYTKNGDTLLAQNWDWYQEVMDCQVILKIGRRRNVPSIVTFTEAGQLAKIGMNGAGLGLVVNNLLSDQSCTGVPWIFLARRVLESSFFAQALGYFLNAKRAHSINFLIGYAQGEAVDIEASPVEENILWPDTGFFVHTNHFLKPGMRFRDFAPFQEPYLSTYLRYRRAYSAMVALKGGINVQNIRKVLSDHVDWPFSVCAHENPNVLPLERVITCLSIIMNLNKKEIYYTFGNPCHGDDYTLKLEQFLS